MIETPLVEQACGGIGDALPHSEPLTGWTI
jgi:hypothetical protein